MITKENESQKHMFYSGHILVLMIWIQNVMADLVILKEDNSILESFSLDNSERIEFQNKRLEYWQKSFPDIKRKFAELFPMHYEKYQEDIETLQHLRDFFAHARYSLKFPMIRYQPTKSRKDLEQKVSQLTNLPYDENQTFMKIEMNEENYERLFNSLMKFENVIFPEIALEMNVNLNRFK